MQLVTPEQFRDARVFAGFSRLQAAAFLGVSLRSVGHWETGKARCPYAAFKLLRVYRHGDLIDPRWSGFRLSRGGHLVTPEGHELAPSDMTWLSLTVRRAHAFSDRLAERVSRKERPRAGAGRQAAPSPDATASGSSDHRRRTGDEGASEASLPYGLVSYSTSDPRINQTAKNKGPTAGVDHLVGAGAKQGSGHQQVAAPAREAA